MIVSAFNVTYTKHEVQHFNFTKNILSDIHLHIVWISVRNGFNGTQIMNLWSLVVYIFFGRRLQVSKMIVY